MAALPAVVLAVLSFFCCTHNADTPRPAGQPDTLLSEEYSFGAFRGATRLQLNPQGSILVVDAGAHALYLYRSPRQEPQSLGGYGWGTTSFDVPTGVASDGLTLYVSDYNNHRIQRFDRNLNFLSSFSTRDTSVAEARFGFPTGVGVTRFGDLFVLDSENVRVAKFSRSLQLERTFGGIEAERGRLRKPSKLVVTPSDRVLVLDDDRIVEYDYFGNFVRSIGEGKLKGVRGFDADRNGILVATEEALCWYSDQGRPMTVQPLAGIISTVPLNSIQDVALSGDMVYLLTAQRAVVMKIVRTP